jgi:hypothetical protein
LAYRHNDDQLRQEKGRNVPDGYGRKELPASPQELEVGVDLLQHGCTGIGFDPARPDSLPHEEGRDSKDERHDKDEGPARPPHVPAEGAHHGRRKHACQGLAHVAHKERAFEPAVRDIEGFPEPLNVRVHAFRRFLAPPNEFPVI